MSEASILWMLKGIEANAQPVWQHASVNDDPTVQPLILESRLLTDQRENMAFAARAESKAVGALAGVQGAVRLGLDLGRPTAQGGIIGLDRNRNEHSGQFNWNISATWGFYLELMRSLGLQLP